MNYEFILSVVPWDSCYWGGKGSTFPTNGKKIPTDRKHFLDNNITIDNLTVFSLTQPCQLSLWEKPEHPEKSHVFWQSVN